MEHLPSDERRVIAAVLDEAARLGLRVSVWDGEEWVLKASDNFAAVRREIGASDTTTLRFRAASIGTDGRRASVGSVFLVHGNGADVLADWSDNSATAALLAPALTVASAVL